MLLLALVPATIFLLLTLRWIHFSPPGIEFFGMLQGDQPAYTVFARGTYLRGNGVLFAQPFDHEADSPRVLVNLTYSALGVLMRVTGDRPVLAWEIWRVVFGGACFALFGGLVARCLNGPARWWALAFGFFGGGASWIRGVSIVLSGEEPSFLKALDLAESGFGWWCLNLFRQGLYPLELAYHTLFFGALLCFLNRRFGLMLVLVGITWASHTITAALLTCALGLALVGDWLREPDRRRTGLMLAGLGGLGAAATIYYGFYLPSFPRIGRWIEQTLQFQPAMYFAYYPPAFGPFLLLPAIALWRPAARFLWHERAGRLCLAWLLAVLFWAHHDWVSFNPVQPIHFVRGHLYAVVVLIAGKALELFLAQGGKSVLLRWGLPLWLGVAVLDNVSFVARVGLLPPSAGILTTTAEGREVIEHYRAKPGSVMFVGEDRGLAVQIMARSSHRAYVSEPFITPDSGGQVVRVGLAMASGDPRRLREIGIDEVILHPRGPSWFPKWIRRPSALPVLMENGRYRVVAVPPE